VRSSRGLTCSSLRIVRRPRSSALDDLHRSRQVVFRRVADSCHLQWSAARRHRRR